MRTMKFMDIRVVSDDALAKPLFGIAVDTIINHSLPRTINITLKSPYLRLSDLLPLLDRAQVHSANIWKTLYFISVLIDNFPP